jgi:prolyl-tRNA editing enzyme YbaK/EbsC (Cys-tRNA(Pro) deacylase)
VRAAHPVQPRRPVIGIRGTGNLVRTGRPVDQDVPVHPNIEAVESRLRAAGAQGGVRLLTDAVRTAAQAAEAVGVGVAQIANSLVFAAEYADRTEPVLVLTSGAHRVDTAKVAALLGAERLRRATPEFVRQHTGQPIGGVAPVGHPAPVRTLVDTALAGYDEIWASGGVPHAVFATGYEELLRLTGGTPAEVS